MKKLIILGLLISCLSGIGFANELSNGNGTSYPYSIDTDTRPETSDDYATEDTPNDSNSAIVGIETELGALPKGSYATVRARLDAIAVSTTTAINYLSSTNTWTGGQNFKNSVTMSSATATNLTVQTLITGLNANLTGTLNTLNITNLNNGVNTLSTTTINGSLSVINSTAAQIVVSGWEPSGASVNNGQILIGGEPSYCGSIHYQGSGAGNLYIGNTYNNVDGHIILRTKESGTPINALDVSGIGNVTIAKDIITNSTGKFGFVQAGTATLTATNYGSSVLAIKNLNQSGVAFKMECDDQTPNNTSYSVFRCTGTHTTTAFSGDRVDFQTATAQEVWQTNFSIFGDGGAGFVNKTTAELKTFTPYTTGEVFYNSTSNSIYVSTGTTVYGFGKIALGATD